MEKRLLLAITLSILILILYPVVLSKIMPQQLSQAPVGNAMMQPIASEPVTTSKETPHNVEHDETLQTNDDITYINSDKYIFSVSDIGGSFKEIKMLNDNKSLEASLVKDASFEARLLAIQGRGVLEGILLQQFAIDKDTQNIYAETRGLLIEKHIECIQGQYSFLAKVTITNKTQLPQTLSFDVTTASFGAIQEGYDFKNIEAHILYNDGKVQKIPRNNFNKINKLDKKDINWAGLKSRYSCIIAKPDFIPTGVFTKSVKDMPLTGFYVNDTVILPGETKVFGFKIYAGPLQLEELEKTEPSFGKMLNFGAISLIILSSLKFFQSIFNNYGVAILILTILISLLLYPLTFKSLKSMKEMQKVQPEIEKIRIDNKNNPTKMNKEIMELYKKHKVNPMGGCLPMILQMPIFFALYQTLMNAVELKGATFLWIKDLSMPDATFMLPAKLPFIGSAINILPILMIFAMIMQQKTSQTNMASGSAQAEQQKIMSMVMPLMIGVIFYSLPSGLILYWLTNTILTTTLQFVFLRHK